MGFRPQEVGQRKAEDPRLEPQKTPKKLFLAGQSENLWRRQVSQWDEKILNNLTSMHSSSREYILLRG